MEDKSTSDIWLDPKAPAEDFAYCIENVRLDRHTVLAIHQQQVKDNTRMLLELFGDLEPSLHDVLLGRIAIQVDDSDAKSELSFSWHDSKGITLSPTSR